MSPIVKRIQNDQELPAKADVVVIGGGIIGATAAFLLAERGLSVFSKRTAPSSMQPFQPFGNDIFVVWDNEDPATDVFLKAGVVTARALCSRSARQSAEQQVDFDVIEKAILDIEKRAANLDDVRKSAETIKSSSDKILKRIELDRDALERQVAVLRERVGDLKVSVNSAS